MGQPRDRRSPQSREDVCLEMAKIMNGTNICPVCGMALGQAYGGTTPCRMPIGASAETAAAIAADYKRRGCVLSN